MSKAEIEQALPLHEICLPFRRRSQKEPVWHEVDLELEITPGTQQLLQSLFASGGARAVTAHARSVIDQSFAYDRFVTVRECLNRISAEVTGVDGWEQTLNALAEHQVNELPLEPAELARKRKDHLTSQGVKGGGFVVIRNLEALTHWAEHAEDLLDKMQRASEAREAKRRVDRDAEMVRWINEQGSDQLKASLQQCQSNFGKLGPARGQYVRERAAIQAPGWTPIPFSALGKAAPSNQPMPTFDAAVMFSTDESTPQKAQGYLIPGAALREQLVSAGFDLPLALAIDTQDDKVVALVGAFEGYVLARSETLAAAKDVMWHTLAEGVRRRGEIAIDYLAPCLEDARWQTWLKAMPEKGPQRLKQWICGESSIWTAREQALAQMLDLQDNDAEALEQMRQLSRPAVAA